MVIVSYSWDSPEHQEWVRDVLVAELRANGIDAIIDVHNLSYGDEPDTFMDDLFARADHIAAVCTPNYLMRSKEATSGVGKEAILIQRRMAAMKPPSKMIPILRSGKAEDAIPIFMGRKWYADLRDDLLLPDVLDNLVASFYGVDMVPAPPIGQTPDWILDRLKRAP